MEISALIRMESLLYSTQHVIVSSTFVVLYPFGTKQIVVGYIKNRYIKMKVKVEADIVDL